MTSCNQSVHTFSDSILRLPDEAKCKCGYMTAKQARNADAAFKEERVGGMKFDAAKNQLELISPTWLEGVGAVLTKGATKYHAENWRQGIELKRLAGGMLRHLNAWRKGEDNDPETGLSHLYHLSCGAMFASELLRTKPEFDDRVKE